VEEPQSPERNTDHWEATNKLISLAAAIRVHPFCNLQSRSLCRSLFVPLYFFFNVYVKSLLKTEFYHKAYIISCIYHVLNNWLHVHVWRYQRGNQNLYIEEEQTTSWSKEKSTKRQTMIYITIGFVNNKKGALESQPQVILAY
jgi:hypothetical protein